MSCMETAAERANGRVPGAFTPPGSCEASLTVLQGERGAVHGLALGRGSALGAGGGAGVDVAAAEAGAQLQAPHVADDGRCVKRLLQTQAGDICQQSSPRWSLFPVTLTLHLLLAKFFRIWRLTDSWMFLQRAVSPAILEKPEWTLNSRFSAVDVGDTYLSQNDHLPESRKAHYWLTNLLRGSPGQLALVSAGSGLGGHPNSSLRLPCF